MARPFNFVPGCIKNRKMEGKNTRKFTVEEIAF